MGRRMTTLPWEGEGGGRRWGVSCNSGITIATTTTAAAAAAATTATTTTTTTTTASSSSPPPPPPHLSILIINIHHPLRSHPKTNKKTN